MLACSAAFQFSPDWLTQAFFVLRRGGTPAPTAVDITSRCLLKCLYSDWLRWCCCILTAASLACSTTFLSCDVILSFPSSPSVPLRPSVAMSLVKSFLSISDSSMLQVLTDLFLSILRMLELAMHFSEFLFRRPVLFIASTLLDS